jgi:hypothetical protein
VGQAKLKRIQTAGRLEQVRPAADRAGAAIRKLATAASSHLGSDCYLHAAIGQALLSDLGIQTAIRAGHAAWRIGPGDEDIMAHKSDLGGYLPDGAQGFAYHVWLETVEEGAASPILIDLTTYQLRLKASQLDKFDGGNTQVDWCPDLLVLRREDLRDFQEVAKAADAGVAYYESVPGYLERLAAAAILDPEDLRLARLIMASPNVNVMGPNQVEEKPVRYREVG